MRRVYAIWMLRKATSPFVLKSLVLLASVWQFKRHVAVRAVLANMPSIANLKASFAFFSYAMIHTQLIVQVSILSGALFALLLVQDIFTKREATYWF